MKTVLVTGATSGIGRQTALLFAQNNYKVIATGRQESRAPRHENIIFKQADLLNTKSISSLTQSIEHLDGIVHAAGIVIRKSFLEFSNDEIQKEFQTHVFATIQLNQELYPILKNSSDASIVFVNSTLGIKPIINTSIYAAAKAAQASLIKSLALEWSPIRVNGIYLGIVDTPIHSFTDSQRKEADTLQILGRIGTSQEAATEILHLYSSKWSTGAINIFDGGILLK
jgi:3-oxoacyl-[acyl-carrier protein] reductase